ncbi:MAG: transposase [Anaerolineae bacterium]
MNDSAENHLKSQELATKLEMFVAPLLSQLDARIKRLVRTFLRTLHAILTFRHSTNGLLLSELGGYILSPQQAPAGTKRLSNLLRCGKWVYTLIERYLWQAAEQQRAALASEQETAYVIWDESVLEKAESLSPEAYVRCVPAKRRGSNGSSRATTPSSGRPIFVPGMQWIGLLLSGLKGVPVVATMRWWSSRGKGKSDKRAEETKLLHRCSRLWGRTVVHIWDRGYASSPWLHRVFQHNLGFILRWPKRYQLVDAKGNHNAWKIVRGKRSLDHRLIWDARRRCWRKTGIVFLPVQHLHHETPLWLVVSRMGKGREPWYLLTNEPIQTVDDAWRVVLAYARRWPIETAFRYNKSELELESPRLWRAGITASSCC